MKSKARKSSPLATVKAIKNIGRLAGAAEARSAVHSLAKVTKRKPKK